MTVFEQPPLPAACRKLNNDEAKRLDSTSGRVWTRPDLTCLTCMKEIDKAPSIRYPVAKGHYRWYDDSGIRDASHVVEYACDCVSQYKLHRWMLNAGIPLNQQRLSWGDQIGLESTRAFEQVFSYAQLASHHVNNGVNMILWSPTPGTGKTFLASFLTKWLLEQGHEPFFATFAEILDLYTSTWRDNEEKAWFDRRVRAAEILVVDDLGREHGGRVEVAVAMLDGVLRSRIQAQLPTVLTSNLTRDQIKAGYGKYLDSLLAERMIDVEVMGVDKRTLMLPRMHQELELELSRPIVLS